MARRLSNETKLKRKVGTGEGKKYKPYITTSEFNSTGTTTVIKDWKTGRGIHCLSQGEVYWYYILRWDDNNIDIREQYPLERGETVTIANKLGVKHPGNNKYIMTTDFLVTEANGALHAYSVKPSKKLLSDRNLEILCIEKTYWEAKNVKFNLLFKEDADEILVHNIRRVVEFYDESNIFDNYSAILHKISRKQIHCDLKKNILTKENICLLEEK